MGSKGGPPYFSQVRTCCAVSHERDVSFSSAFDNFKAHFGTTEGLTDITLRSSVAQSGMFPVVGLGIARIEQQRYRTVHKYTVTANTGTSTLRV